MSTLRQTPLFKHHQAANAKIVDFGGWALPVNYGSQIEEHNAVRNDCGVFDVSHMTVSDVIGPETLEFISYLLANDISKVSDKPGKALYSCILNEEGGVIDDLIVYYLSHQHCRLITNANTNEKDMAWINLQASSFDVQFTEQTKLAIVAVQGPQAIAKCVDLLNSNYAKIITSLARFQGAFLENKGDECGPFVGRTGYTGEDGLEFIINAQFAVELWKKLLDAGVQPCGLGARDTLRLESGMLLYGNDLDEEHTPLESGISWSVANKDERKFIGKKGLGAPPESRMIGLILEDRGVLRSHQSVLLNGNKIGEITSGTFSPSLKKSIAIARINKSAEVTVGEPVQIEVRNKQLNAVVARFPFIKDGIATNPK